jgi:hypothetical protein
MFYLNVLGPMLENTDLKQFTSALAPSWQEFFCHDRLQKYWYNVRYEHLSSLATIER